MVLTPSVMIPLGTSAPDFDLPDVVSGKRVKLSDFKGKQAMLVMFICRHCPYVQHVQSELARLGNEYQKKEVGVVALSSNDAENYPDDRPEGLKAMAKELGFVFPFCYDETQSIAKKYSAACTPDFFVFGRVPLATARRSGQGNAPSSPGHLKKESPFTLFYRGQLDDSRPGNNKPITGADLRGALDAALKGSLLPSSAQRPSIGCNIKWKSGLEPVYFSASGGKH